MCYLIAKKFDKTGCIAVRSKHGKVLADFTTKLQRELAPQAIQLVTISRPSAYGEYEPYVIVENMEQFEVKARVL
ncbi:hypothetical protein RFF05_14240 [Bengtsoniella intestinalis]|uniref:DUF6718 family protein n=1 Tax=Bengtsoniella intestinalis TaxID=3073143 RepID=UPI00391F6D6D